MKKDELKQLRQKKTKELRAKIFELKKELATKQLERAAGKLKNVKEIGKIRRDLAQTLTVLRMLEFSSFQNKSSSGKSEKEAKSFK